MASFQEYRRRSLIPLTGLALAAYFLFVFVPLDRRAKKIDAPLTESWQKLSSALGQTNVTTLDFLHITNQLAETRASLLILERARQKAVSRLEVGDAVRAKMTAPFQLVDFQNERSKQLDELARLAKAAKITVDPPVYAGFPEYTADMRQPTLLWPALSFVNDFLKMALTCKVTALHSLDMPLAVTTSPPIPGAGRLTEVPFEVELTGSGASVMRLLQLLPLHAEEARAAGLPEPPPEKPILFIDQLLIRKQSPEKPDEVRVSLRAVGFVYRE